MPQVKIGPHFFAKEFNDYEDWHWAYVREAAQNGLDAPGSDRLIFDVTKSGDDTLICFENNGEPMTEEVLVDKLLALGESGKNFAGSVGGFGKAKVILYLAHKSYVLRTGTLEVRGCGGDYEIARDLPYFDGTRSEVLVAGDQVDELKAEVRRFIAFCQWQGTFILNGETYKGCLSKGSRRRDLGFGIVYTNKTWPNRLVVRIGGIPMFTSYISFNRCVVLELGGKSSDVLTSNRDGLRGSYRGELQAFITEIAVNKRSALRDRDVGPRYSVYQGRKLEHSNRLEASQDQRQLLHDLVQPVAAALTQQESIPTETIHEDGVVEGVDVVGDDEVTEAVATERGDRDEVRAAAYGSASQSGPVREIATLGHYFVVKNELDMKVPGCYSPEGELSTHSRKLIRFWGRIMLTLHRLFNNEAEFGLGFIFSESAEAEFEDRDFGKMYYLNPCVVVTQSGGARSLKRRFQLTERDRLIAIGAHEFVHQLKFSDHDEDYANKLTDVLAVVMKNRGKFNWCFK
jgi:hypothetical protein